MQVTSQDTDVDSPWIGYAEALLRARRVLLIGIATSWAVVLSTHFLLRRAYDCEATLSFPPVIPKLKADDAQRVGVPLAFYRKLFKLLSSEEVLSNGLKGVLAAHEVRNLHTNLDRHLVPLTTNPVGDVKRMTTDDSVIGAQIAYSATAPEQATRGVNALAKLCRNAFLHVLLAEHVEFEAAAANRRRADLLRKRAHLTYVEESLRLQVKDVSRLVREFPTLPPALAQQVVDARGEGGRFLSPTVQMVGVKAHQAQTAHDIRVLDGEVNLESIRLAFLRQLDHDVYGGSIESQTELPGDVVELIRGQFASFASSRSEASNSTALALLKNEVDGLAAALASASDTTRFVQLPTVRRVPRGALILGWLAFSALVVVVLALARDAWTRSHVRGGIRAPANG